MATTTRLQACACPDCGTELDAATDAIEDNRPLPGDASICIKCGCLLVFTNDLTLRRPTDQEADILVCDPKVRAILQVRLRLKQ